MNDFKHWIIANKILSGAIAIFVVLLGLLSWLTYSGWDSLGQNLAKYTQTKTDLDSLLKQKPFPDQANLSKLSDVVAKEQADLEHLKASLTKFRIAPAGDLEKIKLSDRPQYFQDALRDRVSRIKALASNDSVTLPPGFYLGFEEFENRLPQPDETLQLGKLLTAFDWIAGQIASQKGALLVEFSRPVESAKKDPTKDSSAPKKPVKPAEQPVSEQIGTLRVTMRTSQAGFREFVNALSTGPCFALIDSLQIQNSASEPPRKDFQPQADQTPGATNAIQRLPIIVGRETLNVTLRLRVVDFPSTVAPAASK
jgi:hypothetical protein